MSGLTCPECGSVRLKVTDSRPSGDKVRRRRKCLNCAAKFTTFESHEKDAFGIRLKLTQTSEALDKLAGELKQFKNRVNL